MRDFLVFGILGYLAIYVMTEFRDVHQKLVKLPDGKKVHWRISAYATIFNEKNELLLMRPRFDKERWVLPGGEIEIHESLKKGIERETYEETGYKAEIDTTHPIYCGESKFFENIEAFKFYHSIILVYPGKLMSDKQDTHVINTVYENEVESVDWVTLDKINENNCHAVMYPAIKQLIQNRNT